MLGKISDIDPTDPNLSPSMQRLFTQYPSPDDYDNEFFTNFKYSRITGIGKVDSASRRDPTKVIKVDDLYYVWYTKRDPGTEPFGMDNGTDTEASVDWDLADINYATSKDGFDWMEQGIAVGRSPKGQYGDRSVTTPDILVFEGKYYLFYQTFTGKFSSQTGDRCDVSMAWADSPRGPWTKTTEPVLPLGTIEEWDGGAIHDPYPLIYKGKIWVFYKGQPGRRSPGHLVRAQGVAIADRPEGPYVKPDMNPVLNSGHETCLWPYKEGLCALSTVDGPEKNTIQYAPDGIHFKPMASVTVPPIAPGPYCPDIFSGNGDGKGITWGLSHITKVTLVDTYRRIVESESFLVRFDCDLHRDTHRPYFRNPRDQVGRFEEATFFAGKMVLEENAKAEVIKENKEIDNA